MNRILPFVIGAVLLIGASPSVAQTHTIEIRDARVFVDGRPLGNGEDARLKGMEGRFIAPDGAAVLIELDGRVMRLSARGIEDAQQLFALASRDEAQRLDTLQISVPAEAGFIAAQAEELRARAREMERIGVRLQSSRVPDYELFQMIEMLRHSAMEAERVAQALPHFRVQGYLSDVREQNEELYDRLVREQRLEEESLRLSAEIRSLNGADRDARIADLRTRLEEIFQMKQENRQREIEEIEARLATMQKRLEKRERYHDFIIERRLNELIGSEEPGQDR